MRAKILWAGSAAILLSLVSLDSASAEGGCGPGFHRGPYEGCRPNAGRVVVVPGAPVVVAPAPAVVAPRAVVLPAPAVAPAPAVVAPAPVVVAPAPAIVGPAPVLCGGGFRWHPRLRRCVVL